MGVCYSTSENTLKEILESRKRPTWRPHSVIGVLASVNREEGSTVKELYVSDWNAVYFEQNGTIEVRDQKEPLIGTNIYISLI